MSETVREFALEQLHLSGAEGSTRQAHAEWYLGFAELHEVVHTIPITQAQLDLLDGEWPNLQAALDWYEMTGRLIDRLRLAAALYLFWYLRGHVQAGWECLHRALAQGNDAPPVPRGRALTGLALLATVRDDAGAADRFAWHALDALRPAGDSGLTHIALIVAGFVAVHLGDHGRAEGLFNQALAIAETIVDSVQRATARADCLTNLGDLSHTVGDVGLGMERQEEALAIYREVGDGWGMIETLHHLGGMTRDLGEYERSLAWYRECLDLAWYFGDRRVVAVALTGVACAAGAWGQAEFAARLIGAADTVLVEAGMSTLPPVDRVALERAEVSARALIGDDAFDSERRAGRELPAAEIAELVAALAPERGTKPAPADMDTMGLSTRELEVLRLVAAGYSDREVGAALFIGTRTVETHVSCICGNLGVRGRTAAVVSAMNAGLVRPPDPPGETPGGT